MSITPLVPTARRRTFASEADLVEALGIRFSDEQLAAITAPMEPGVIIAGAGSGKTTVMAARVVWLVGIGAVRPEEVLGLTFTRKAAAELSGRVRAALLKAGVIAEGVDESGEQLIMTYDAFAARLVAEHGLRIGFEADPTMITGATRFRLASRVVKNAAGPFEYISRLKPITVTERVLKLDSDLQQHLVGVAELDGHARDYRVALESAPLNNRGNVYADVKKALVAVEERLELASLVTDYSALKHRLGLVEFADQMAIAARLAAEVPEVSTVLRNAFKVVLLDEYQDTSAAQAIMLRGLFSGATPYDGLGHPVTAVGDPFQAIYGWRGAAASNILQFADEFRTPVGARASRFALTVNRRSGQTILDVANTVSKSLRGSKPLRGETGVEDEGMGMLHAPAEAGPGRVKAATFESWPEEVSWIGEQVLAVRDAQTVANWSDIAILSRRNADIGPLYAELTARDVPVEIVGLGGLLQLPEIMDVVSTMRLVDDVTANPDLIRLLGGPRWNIGPRDLALLGRRARELARQSTPDRPTDDDHGRDLLQALEEAVADVDPTEVVCLLDALENPGEVDFSAAARERFARLATELGYLRRHGDDPVLDLTRRVITTLGLDVELMATPEFNRTSRRNQLGAFLDAVGDYVDVDGSASLSGLLAYLQAEVDQGNGLDQSVPSDTNAVKLLTVHRAKGLEWEVVFLPGLVKGVFPSDRVTDNWVTNPAVLPAELRGDAGSIPHLEEASYSAMGDYKKALTRQQLLSEDRLAYVAVTRAKQVLYGSGHTWRPELTNPRVASTYLRALLEEAERQDQVLHIAPPAGTENPLVSETAPQPWPRPYDPDTWARRQTAAAMVSGARERKAGTGHYDVPGGTDAQLFLDQEETVAAWDADTERLLTEIRESRHESRVVALPGTLSATAMMRLQEAPEEYAAELARPMPRQPSRAARFGSRFHQWVERYFGQQQLIDPDDLPDRADAGVGEESDLRELCQTFAAGRYGDRVPAALEAPFTVMVAGSVIRGRIDALYRLPDEGPYRYQVVDWKTHQAGGSADPLQLAIYRLAVAELKQVPLEQVDAVFYYVRRDVIERPAELPDREGIEALLRSVPAEE